MALESAPTGSREINGKLASPKPCHISYHGGTAKAYLIIARVPV